MNEVAVNPVSGLSVPLERDLFLRSLLRELAGTLETVVGIEESAGFISIVGQRIGDQIGSDYRAALQTDRLTPQQLGEVLVDLKRRIEGTFSIVEHDHRRIVFQNTQCPFADKVLDRPSLCMMTSNVFGTIAAHTAGRARVVLEQTIAQRHGHCRVVLYLGDASADQSGGREYFNT